MLSKSAIRPLSIFGEVVREAGRYRCELGEGVISFRDERGKAVDLRLRRNQDETAPESMSAAIREALFRTRLLVGPDQTDLMVSLSIDRKGRSFEPLVVVIVLNLRPGHLSVAKTSWTDQDALNFVGAAIDGQVSEKDVLEWLVGRGGSLGALVKDGRR